MPDIEQELSAMDFSHLSKVRDSLYLRLKLERKKPRALSLDELQLVTAAGSSGNLGTAGQRAFGGQHPEGLKDVFKNSSQP